VEKLLVEVEHRLLMATPGYIFGLIVLDGSLSTVALLHDRRDADAVVTVEIILMGPQFLDPWCRHWLVRI
jgi:hypothetical protein